MDKRKIRRQTKRVVTKVAKLVHAYPTIGKREFEEILGKVREHVQRNTGVSMRVIMQKTDKVLRDLPEEYGQLSEDSRSWAALIAYLYTKYLKELDIL